MKSDVLQETLNKIDPEKNIALCPGCGVNPAVDCGYGYRDYWGDFDCVRPDTEDIICEDCPHILCPSCKERYEQRSNNQDWNLKKGGDII